MRSPARVLGGVVALLSAALLTSCVQVPDAGPVMEEEQRPAETEPLGQYNNPPPPVPGASATDVVNGFLTAMTATPLQIRTAQKYLTGPGKASWQPKRVIVYTSHSTPRGTDEVHMRIRGGKVGADAQWRGMLSHSAQRMTFPMVKQGGEWRIASAPNALIVSRQFFDAQFQDAQLYYFDPSGRILVPETVHVPQGSQLASALLRALLTGPPASLTGVTRTFLPQGMTLGLSVVVGKGGVAEVSLRGPDPGPLSTKATQLMLAQLTWTLREDPAITAFRLTINDRQVTEASGVSTFRTAPAPADPHDPAVSQASSLVFALHRGKLVSGSADHPTKVTGPFGKADLGIGAFAVSLDGNQMAGIDPGGLLVGPVVEDTQPSRVLTGPGLLRPAWDFANRLWEVQNGPRGATVICLDRGRLRDVRVPGITGEAVNRFLVSRDGSRLVAVLRGPRVDKIVVSRLRYNSNDRVVGATRARPIRWFSGDATRVRDIGWTSPTTIAVLNHVGNAHSETRIFDVDGSTPPNEAQPVTLTGDVVHLATSPVAGQTPYAVFPHSIDDLSQVGPTRPLVTLGLGRITYVG